MLSNQVYSFTDGMSYMEVCFSFDCDVSIAISLLIVWIVFFFNFFLFFLMNVQSSSISIGLSLTSLSKNSFTCLHLSARRSVNLRIVFLFLSMTLPTLRMPFFSTSKLAICFASFLLILLL